MTKFLSLLTLGLFSLGGLTACNTIEGIGNDVQAAGEKLGETAEENKNY